MSILLFDTVLGTSNIGDEIIFKSLEEQIQPFLDRSQVIRYGTHVVNFTLPLYLTMRSKRNMIRRTQYKIIMGTNLLSYNLFKTRKQWMITPFNHMIYLRDGMTDVPCMRTVKANNGYSIGVYLHDNTDTVNKLLKGDRINFAASADYRENSQLDQLLHSIIAKIVAEQKLSDFKSEEI